MIIKVKNKEFNWSNNLQKNKWPEDPIQDLRNRVNLKLQKFKGPYLEGRNDPNGTIGHYRFCINKIHKKEKKE
jgi:hypothetical protein